MGNFEPVIVAFCCHYCAYTAADMAGSMRLSYPSNVKIVRVPCTGKVDIKHMMQALRKGLMVYMLPAVWKEIAILKMVISKLPAEWQEQKNFLMKSALKRKG